MLNYLKNKFKFFPSRTFSFLIICLVLIVVTLYSISNTSIEDLFNSLPVISSETKEIITIINAIEREDDEQKVLHLKYILYDKYKHDQIMGPIVSLNYAHELFFFENGFEDGQKIIHEALNTFPENKELLRASKDMFIYLHENQIIAYFNAVDAIESNPNDSIPVLQEFHSKYKNNYYFEEETFYYLAKAYFAAGQIDKGKKLIKYGLSKFPQDEDSLNLQKDYE